MKIELFYKKDEKGKISEFKILGDKKVVLEVAKQIAAKDKAVEKVETSKADKKVTTTKSTGAPKKETKKAPTASKTKK